MAGFDYAKMQATASRLLDRFAQGTVTLTKPGATTPGPKSWDPPVLSEPVVYTLDATVKGVSAQFVDGTTILATDLEITAAIFGADPAPPDKVEIDGKAVVVLKTIRLPAAGTVVAWKFIVRA